MEKSRSLLLKYKKWESNMTDFQMALVIFFILVILGILSIFSETLCTIFMIFFNILEILWNLFLLIVFSGILISIIYMLVHIYRMKL